MNLASALTDGFAKDIGVNQNTINLGNQLMFLGIVVLEIPSNIILQRVSVSNHFKMLYSLTSIADRATQMDVSTSLHLRPRSYVASLCER